MFYTAICILPWLLQASFIMLTLLANPLAAIAASFVFVVSLFYAREHASTSIMTLLVSALVGFLASLCISFTAQLFSKTKVNFEPHSEMTCSPDYTVYKELCVAAVEEEQYILEVSRILSDSSAPPFNIDWTSQALAMFFVLMFAVDLMCYLILRQKMYFRL
ncbi:hypothetical protein [Enterovibrio norvegicus]|uniref:hypothetical protein n=1 Tax=Enterovibrio norvegicus TaxID=188144 RepID=UPI00352F498C